MIRDDARTHRFAKTWLGPSLATLVGIGSSFELAAMPIPAPGAQLLGPTLIQQSPSPQKDAQQPAGPPSADASMPDEFIELHEALRAARERLSGAAEAVAATGQLQQERAALREENQLLRAQIEALTKEVEQTAANAREMHQELVTVRRQSEQRTAVAEAHAAELTETVEQATAKARETDQELAAVRGQSERRIAAADSARIEAEARLSEMRDNLQRAEQEKARVGADLARVQGELANAKEQVAAAEQERAELAQRTAALENERDDWHTRWADAAGRLGRSEATKDRLEREVAQLREAARTTADDTRQLIEALAAIGLAAGPLETDAALLAESGTPSASERADDEWRAAAAPAANVAAVAAPGQGPEPGSADADLQRTETASAVRPGDEESAYLDQRGILGGRPAVFPMLADLPLEERLHVQGLLADLRSKLDEQGLMTTVPGELLFAAGSDEVQAGAYDTLAKVAELISMYDDRQVLIIGHSDADGDAADNQQLSERRAELVKQIFVENFDVAADRLSTEGFGEARPITSNATPQGRRANRRVEVVILN
jgi:outer membrane protein OmpA-like peptidoglycan-associated protein/predicted  nucleic acid-binding Zn-ribbon protein